MTVDCQLAVRVNCTTATAPGNGRDAGPCHHTCQELPRRLADQLWIDAVQLASLLPALLAYLLEHQPWAHARALTAQQRRVFVQFVLPPCRWFEVDQLEVIQYKHRLLKSAGAAIRVSHAQQVSSEQSSGGQAWECSLASSSRGLTLHEVT